MMKSLFSLTLVTLLTVGAQCATITVNYNSQNGAWTTPAMDAFEKAVEMWEEAVFSPFEIKINAYYEDFTSTQPGLDNVLAYAYANGHFSGLSSTHPAYFPSTDYPVALAEKLHGSQIPTWSGHPYHITIYMNSGATNPDINWNYSISYNPMQNTYDFVSTAAHEIGHGLGFASSSRPDTSIQQPVYSSAIPRIMDRFIVQVSGTGTTSLTSLASSGAATEAFLTSGQVFFDGQFSVATNGSAKPELYSPNVWDTGSSISHWDQGYFSSTNHDAMMHPQASFSANSFHRHIGNVTTSFMRDIGWDIWPTGVEERLSQLDPVAYPNPSTEGRFFISSEQARTYSVYDLRGNIILESYDGNGRFIDLRGHPAGVYILRFEDHAQDKYQHIKLIKTR